MEGFTKTVMKITRFFNGIAGVSLTFLMAITVTDIILRFFGRPIVGTYEVVSFAGAVVIGFALPVTTWMRGHIYVDFMILKLPRIGRDCFNITTRCLCIVLFLLIGWRLMKYGLNVYRSGELSPTLQLPFYPIAFGLGISSFVQCLVLFCDIPKIMRRQYE